MADDDAALDSHDSEVSLPTTTAQTILSLLQPVRRGVNHMVWFDRGMLDVSTLQQVGASGLGASALMQQNRVGLPRRLLKRLAADMKCPARCQHEAGSTTCRRWSWCVLHKGEWELQLFADAGKWPVMVLSNCTSAARQVREVRQVGNRTFQVMTPEAVGLYNVHGRSAVDGTDIKRKKISLAVRRQLRQGPKRALFDAEIGFVCGSTIHSHSRPASERLSVNEFAVQYAHQVLSEVSVRKRRRATQDARDGSVTRGEADAHRPMWVRKRSRSRDGFERQQAKRGRRCCLAPECAAGEPKQPSFFCPGCKGKGCSGWYHFDCYWSRHSAALCAPCDS